MRIAFLSALIALICLSGCLGQKPFASVPADLRIEAMTNTCPALSASPWSERVAIDSSGDGIYEYTVYRDYNDRGHVESKAFRLSEGELSSLLDSIDGSGFFGLKGEDSGLCVWDICGTIQITRNGTTKTYRNEGCDVKAFDDTEGLIRGIAKNKTKTG